MKIVVEPALEGVTFGGQERIELTRDDFKPGAPPAGVGYPIGRRGSPDSEGRLRRTVNFERDRPIAFGTCLWVRVEQDRKIVGRH